MQWAVGPVATVSVHWSGRVEFVPEPSSRDLQSRQVACDDVVLLDVDDVWSSCVGELEVADESAEPEVSGHVDRACVEAGRGVTAASRSRIGLNVAARGEVWLPRVGLLW